MIDEAQGVAVAIIGASIRGPAHIRRDKPNQDAHDGFRDAGWSLIAVADGHGSEECFRSDRGSRFAVAAVAEICRAAIDADRTGETLRRTFIDVPDRIVAAWRALVEADALADPDLRFATGDLHVAYGATCVAALIGPSIGLFLQVGDGDLVVGAPGEGLVRPLPDDEGLVGEQTCSICLPDAPARFRSLLVRAPHAWAQPEFVSVSTDGLSKSFKSEAAFLETMSQWRGFMAEHGTASAEAGLADWLSGCARDGSGDDTTLMMFSAVK
jgi:hypothetical protein